MDLLEFNIDQYDLSNDNDYKNFLKIKATFLALLSEAYGKKYFGDTAYNRKIDSRNLDIFVVAKKSLMIGCLTVKHKKKLSGMAVLNRFQRRGIGTALVVEAQKNFPYLYGEIALSNHRVQQMVRSLNFKPVRDSQRIRALLKEQNDDVTIIDERSEYVSYIHAEHIDQVDRQKDFVIFEYFGRNP